MPTGEPFYARDQKIGECRTKDVLGERSCEWQARKDTGVFYQNDTGAAGPFGVEGVVWYDFLTHAFVYEFMTSRIYKIIICILCDIAAFPFIKNPEDNPVYSIHFSRQWHDTMLVSLHNFLATIFQVSKRSTFVTLQNSNQFHQINDRLNNRNIE